MCTGKFPLRGGASATDWLECHLLRNSDAFSANMVGRSVQSKRYSTLNLFVVWAKGGSSVCIFSNPPRVLDLDDRQGLIASSAMQ